MCDKLHDANKAGTNFAKYVLENGIGTQGEYHNMLRDLSKVSLDDQFVLNHAMAYYISTVLSFSNGIAVNFSSQIKYDLESDLNCIKSALLTVNADLIINCNEIIRLSRMYYNALSKLVDPLAKKSKSSESCLFMSGFGFEEAMSENEYHRLSEKSNLFIDILNTIKAGMPYIIALRS